MNTKVWKPTGSRRKREDWRKTMKVNNMPRRSIPQEQNAVWWVWCTENYFGFIFIIRCSCVALLVLPLVSWRIVAVYLISLETNSIKCSPVAFMSRPAKTHKLYVVNWLLWLNWTNLKMLSIHLKAWIQIFQNILTMPGILYSLYIFLRWKDLCDSGKLLTAFSPDLTSGVPRWPQS